MKNSEDQALSLTSDYFKLLVDEIHSTFLEKHKLKKLPKNYQLYGYGDFDESKPSLKTDLEAVGTEFINGKYLYDKTRQVYKGRPIIKLSKYYKSILLMYLGYSNIKQFIDAHDVASSITQDQIDLLYNEGVNKTYYYISYYFGEDQTLLKGRTIISENFKKIQHTYVYPQDDGSHKTHYSYGTIIRREDTLHINTKTLLDSKLVEGGSEIYYIGHSDPANTQFLVGAYVTFDIYTQPVAGKSIFEKCSSKEDMETRSKDGVIPAYIAQELRNQRIVSENIVPKHYNALSRFAPYAPIYKRVAGNYIFTFNFEEEIYEKLNFIISDTDYRIKLLNDEVYIENDSFNLFNKGSVLHFSFKLAGLTNLDRVDVYLKTYFLNDNTNTQSGVFSGVDNENRLVNGTITVEYTPE
jgi:hypothetical protein